MTLSSKQTAFLAQLQDRVGDVTFIYGMPTISGDAECVLMLAVEQDEEGRAEYVATITGPHLPGSEAEGLEWRVVDDIGQELHGGKTGRRGQFRFPVDQELAARPSPPTCCLSLVPVPVAASAANSAVAVVLGPVQLPTSLGIGTTGGAAPDIAPEDLSDSFKHWGLSNDKRDLVLQLPFDKAFVQDAQGSLRPIYFPVRAALLRIRVRDGERPLLRLMVVYRNEQLGLFEGRRPLDDLPLGATVEELDSLEEPRTTIGVLSDDERRELLQDPNIHKLLELKQLIDQLQNKGVSGNE